jgi:hypothetical protein
LSCERMEIAQAAGFAGLLAWRYYQRAAFPQRRPSMMRAASWGHGDERFAAVVCGLTQQVRSQSDRLPPYSRAAATALLEVTNGVRAKNLREFAFSSATAERLPVFPSTKSAVIVVCSAGPQGWG